MVRTISQCFDIFHSRDSSSKPHLLRLLIFLLHPHSFAPDALNSRSTIFASPPAVFKVTFVSSSARILPDFSLQENAPAFLVQTPLLWPESFLRSTPWVPFPSDPPKHSCFQILRLFLTGHSSNFFTGSFYLTLLWNFSYPKNHISLSQSLIHFFNLLKTFVENSCLS